MATKASQILQMFIRDLNEHPECQTMFTCIAVEDNFNDFIDADILQGYAKFLGFNHVLQNKPEAVTFIDGEYKFLNSSAVLDELMPASARDKFEQIGKVIFETHVNLESRNSLYWKDEEIHGVHLRFGVLHAMINSPYGDMEFDL
jgi:hypothetical protein